MDWGRLNGPTPTEKTGPEFDHTFQHTNTSGYYMFVNMNQHADDPEKKNLIGFASNSVMNSVVFNPPPLCHSNETSPFKNTCMARLFVHQFGLNSGSFNISVVELKERENITTTLWWSSKNIGDKWERVEVVLPNITSKYFMQVEARKGMRIFSDVAIDDFSMSPECFGFNIPKEHLKNYNYWDPRLSMMKKPHADFVEKKGILNIHEKLLEICNFNFVTFLNFSIKIIIMWSSWYFWSNSSRLLEILQWHKQYRSHEFCSCFR